MRVTIAASVLLALASCAPADGNLCVEMATRCGGARADDWRMWCESDCIPWLARTRRCAANDACILCDAREDGQTVYFGLPPDLEYLWTVVLGPDEVVQAAHVDPPTGIAFDDRPGTWSPTATGVGAWRSFQPYDVAPLATGGYCEPGPNQFLTSNMLARGADVVLSAVRTSDAQFCSYADCPVGPYPACGAPVTSACTYRDPPETRGVGTAAQLDRSPGPVVPTYGFGRYRSVHAVGDADVGPAPGVVYAMFVQSNLYCVDGRANTDSNTSEIDVEISSGEGHVFEAGPFCHEGDMCFQVVNWLSSGQGVADARAERREASGFRFRDPARARALHTWGFDWAPNDVRYTYDSDPSDCDERAGTCPIGRGSLAICRHTRFIPQRPSTLHLQLWNARWAGRGVGGQLARMRIERVWHQPY